MRLPTTTKFIAFFRFTLLNSARTSRFLLLTRVGVLSTDSACTSSVIPFVLVGSAPFAVAALEVLDLSLVVPESVPDDPRVSVSA